MQEFQLKNTAEKVLNTKTVAVINTRPKVQSSIKTREVHQWSGQTAVGEFELPTVQPTHDDSIYITPSAVSEFEPETNGIDSSRFKDNKHAITEQVNKSVISASIPNCPKCNDEMVERVVKKGAH